MSFSAIKWALKQPVSPIEKLVLVFVADHANEKTLQCFPSVGTIAAESGLSARSVIRSLNKLVELGLIERSDRFTNNRQTSNIYTVKIKHFLPDLEVANPHSVGAGGKPNRGDTESPSPVTQSHPRGCHRVIQNHSILITSHI